MFFLRLMVMAAALAGLSFATPINVALFDSGGLATQSTTDMGAARVANDGVLGVGSSGFSDTKWTVQPWWKVTFDKPYFISSINVYGRSDWSYDGSILISVFLKDSEGVEVWSATDVELETLTPFSLDTSKKASSLTVQVSKYNDGASGDLQLAEVEAMGSTSAPTIDTPPIDPLPTDPPPTSNGATPEPATYALMAGGLAFIVIIHRRKR